MAKKKKTTRTRKKPSARQAQESVLPDGFWPQTSAVVLVIVSILFIATWLGAGGPVLDWFNGAAMIIIGYAVYLLPFVLVYLAVEIFKNEDNRIPVNVSIAATLLVVFVAGLCGLLVSADGSQGGGFIGGIVNSGMLALVSSGVAIFIYIILVLFATLLGLRIAPHVLVSGIADLVRRDETEDEQNVKVIREAETEAEEGFTPRRRKPKIDEDFKLNEGVPLAKNDEPVVEKPVKKGRLSSLRGSAEVDKVAEEQPALVMATDQDWELPSYDLLEKKQKPANAGDIQGNAAIIQDTFDQFGIAVKMEGANVGPKVTQYTLSPPSGVKLTKITALETNLALNLAAQSLRIEAPIPGKRAVGIEVPNERAADVRLHGILSSKEWKKADQPLSFAIGKDISGQAVVGELNKMPHLLVAGQTGSGKSVMINTLLTSLLYRNSPSQMKMILVDPKQVEMAPYKDIPHLLTPVITDPEKTISALKWAVNEMERRYSLLAEEGIRDIKTYNQHIKKRGKQVQVQDEDGNMQEVDEGTMPYIVVVIDELADLMMVAAKDVEALIVRLAQKARAVGIHLVLATQRPSVDVITGLIKANVPARIAFTVASNVDSRTILDQVGAEKLLGQGDMLMKTAQMGKPRRVQGAWVMDDEVMKICDHLRMQSEPRYNDEIVNQPVQIGSKGGIMADNVDTGGDSMFAEAVQVILRDGKASTSHLQRRLSIGYGRASRIIDQMEDQGIIGQANGSKPREILISSLDDIEL